ncbi:MAG: helix-turn-helix domain-containing protein [Oscillibacter sp.]|nr:helix-turn-helix domain-containing protein [Oscillibacter sp.]
MYYRRIFDLREDHDLTQKAISEFLAIHPNVYRRYEKGEREIPVGILLKLADYYHVSTDYLLGRTDDPTPPTGR